MGEHDVYTDYNPDGTYAKSVAELAAEITSRATAEQLPEVRLLRPQPGDVIVVRLDRDLSARDLNDLGEQVRSVLPQAVPVLFLDRSSDLEVVRKDGA